MISRRRRQVDPRRIPFLLPCREMRRLANPAARGGGAAAPIAVSNFVASIFVAAVSAIALALVLAGPLTAEAGAPLTAEAGAPLTARPQSPLTDEAPAVCTITGAIEPDSLAVAAGSPLGIDLSLSGTCPDGTGARADIFLLLDRSSSMGEAGKLEAAHGAVRDFVQNVDFARHRVGLVAFTGDAYVLQTLTHDPQRVLTALANSGQAEQATNIAKAILTTSVELDATARAEAVRVMVLLTDGQSNPDAMNAAARAAIEQGTEIFAVALGPDADRDALRQVASSKEHIAYAATPEELDAIYARIAAIIQDFSVTDVTITARLGAGASYIAGSGEPGEPSGSVELAWWRPVVSRDATVTHLAVRLSRVGVTAPIAAAWADYTDADGARRRYHFPPMALIDVLAPTKFPIYLPAAFRGNCLPSNRGVDVALALDNSDSMRGAKLTAAVEAAKGFVALLEAGTDQVAIVRYDAESEVVVPLTSNLGRAAAGLDLIAAGHGTRLDKGIDAGAREVMGARHRASNRAVVVVLSDGRQTQLPGEAVAAAEIARMAGVTLFAIGLGADADPQLLEAVAGSPSRVFFAPEPSDLASIYERVGGAVGCR